MRRTCLRAAVSIHTHLRRFAPAPTAIGFGQHRTIKAAVPCAGSGRAAADFTVIHKVLPQNHALSVRKIYS